jgi:hypothetical protein
MDLVDFVDIVDRRVEHVHPVHNVHHVHRVHVHLSVTSTAQLTSQSCATRTKTARDPKADPS